MVQPMMMSSDPAKHMTLACPSNSSTVFMIGGGAGCMNHLTHHKALTHKQITSLMQINATPFFAENDAKKNIENQSQQTMKSNQKPQ